MNDKKMILIVDDDRSIIQLAEDILKKLGYHTVSTTDGKRACELVRMCPPDLIVLDLGLPGMGGYEVLKSLQVQEYRSIPIILITGQQKDESLIDILKNEQNVKGYLTKPITVDVFISEVKKILQH